MNNNILLLLMMIGTEIKAQQLNSTVVNSTVDNANISISNPTATSLSGASVSNIWLDNTGKMIFRNATGNGYSFRNSINNQEQLIIDDAGNLTIGGARTGNMAVPVGAVTEAFNINFQTWRDIVAVQTGTRIRAERINNWMLMLP
jgi:hypothetical protein